MNVKIEKSTAFGTVIAPKSKSMAHRMLISGAICGKPVEINGIEDSEDVSATLDALRAIGVSLEKKGDTVKISSFTPVKEAKIDCRESGSTLRFFIPICIALGIKASFMGKGRLLSRPLDVYEKIAREQELDFIRNECSLTVDGKLNSSDFSVSGSISSQFITGLIFAICLSGKGGTIEIIPPVVSSPYIDMTVKAVNLFGFTAKRDGNSVTVSVSRCPFDDFFTVEGDYSNSAFLEALNLFDGKVKVSGLDNNSLQGDKAYRVIFSNISRETTVDISQTPDLGPIIIAIMAAKRGGTLLGTSSLRLKESDRGESMRAELIKFGIDIALSDDSIIIPDKELHTPTHILDSHNDHRISMALAVLCTQYGGVISGAECVNKSYPDFWSDLKTLGIAITEE